MWGYKKINSNPENVRGTENTEQTSKVEALSDYAVWHASLQGSNGQIPVPAKQRTPALDVDTWFRAIESANAKVQRSVQERLPVVEVSFDTDAHAQAA